MARVDFLTDEENEDIILSATGEFQFTSTIQDSLAQRLGIRLQTWQGNWAYNNYLHVLPLTILQIITSFI